MALEQLSNDQLNTRARYRELATQTTKPDPRTVPYRPDRRRLGDLSRGLLTLAAVIGMWWSTIELVQLAASLSAH